MEAGEHHRQRFHGLAHPPRRRFDPSHPRDRVHHGRLHSPFRSARSLPAGNSAGVSASADAIVIGAGIVGAATAYALAREGMRVTILESGFAAGGATAAGMGHLVAMDDSCLLYTSPSPRD